MCVLVPWAGHPHPTVPMLPWSPWHSRDKAVQPLVPTRGVGKHREGLGVTAGDRVGRSGSHCASWSEGAWGEAGEASREVAVLCWEVGSEGWAACMVSPVRDSRGGTSRTCQVVREAAVLGVEQLHTDTGLCLECQPCRVAEGACWNYLWC